MDKLWSKATVRNLHFAYCNGLTFTQMGALLGRTRNAVSGKIERLRRADPERWRLRPREWPTKGSSPRARIQTPLPPLEGSIFLEDDDVPFKVDIPDLALFRLEQGECRWPIGDVGAKGFRFCAEEAAPGCPYCALHMRVAHGSW